MSEKIEKVGAVSQSRYEQTVAELRKVVSSRRAGSSRPATARWRSSRCATRGGFADAGPAWTVTESLRRLAEDIRLKANTIKTARRVATR
ncbi:hypothetical protein [Streptomyces sp. NPDC000405]|uniref:hypothetical protein n=1 Tax=Streptomyces sp. NPDC000405 TaxID=3161033 RepID=UPI00398D311A